VLLARYEQIAWQLFAEGGFGEIGQTRSPRRDGHGAVQCLIQSSRHYRTAWGARRHGSADLIG
jgi:hypothetical protein